MCKKNEQKNIKKNNIYCILIIITLFIAILIPIVLHIIYRIPAISDFFVAIIPIQDLLAYEGAIIGSLFLFITVYITIKNTKKDNKRDYIIKCAQELISVIDVSDYTSSLTYQYQNGIYIEKIEKIQNTITAKEEEIKLYLSKEQYDEYFKRIKKTYNDFHFNILLLINLYNTNKKIPKLINLDNLAYLYKMETIGALKTIIDSFDDI